MFHNKKGDMLSVLGFIIFAIIIGSAILYAPSKVSYEGAVSRALVLDTTFTTKTITYLPNNFNIYFNPQLDVENRCMNFDENSISAVLCDYNAYSQAYDRDQNIIAPLGLIIYSEDKQIPYSQLTIDRTYNKLSFSKGTSNPSQTISLSQQFTEKYLYVSINDPNINEILISFNKIATPLIKSETKESAKVHIIFNVSNLDKTTIKYSSSNQELLGPLATKLNQKLNQLNLDIPNSFSLYDIPFMCTNCNSNEIIIELEKKFKQETTNELEELLGASITSIFE